MQRRLCKSFAVPGAVGPAVGSHERSGLILVGVVLISAASVLSGCFVGFFCLCDVAYNATALAHLVHLMAASYTS